MKNIVALFLVPLLTLALSGCGNNEGGGGGTEPPMVVACTADGSNITAAKANNYSFTSTLTFPPAKVKPNSELNFDWSGVTRDFLGHSVNAANDLTLISVLSWNLNLQQLEAGLNADTLLQKDLTVVPLTLTTDGTTTGVSKGATSAKLYTFTLNGGPVTPDQIQPYFDINDYPPQYTTYTLMAASGNVVDQGVRMIQSFLLDSGTSNTDVKMTDTSTHLTYSANMHSATPTGVPLGTGDITLDWTTMDTTALGTPFDPTSVTYALVGHYSEKVLDLEKKFLDIQLIATELFEATISVGTSIKLSELTKDGSKSFSGITSEGTWVVALQCGACRNPAPWYLSVLRQCNK
jgi:hypothetical protein